MEYLHKLRNLFSPSAQRSAFSAKIQSSAFRIFFCLIALVALWFSYFACVGLYNYIVLSSHTSATKIHWSVKELSDERFVLHGTYTYKVGESTYSGETTLQHFPYRNSGAAESAIPEYAAKQWEVWYSPSNLTHSTLQKNFPLKECLSSLILWGILIYFICLKKYVEKKM